MNDTEASTHSLIGSPKDHVLSIRISSTTIDRRTQEAGPTAPAKRAFRHYYSHGSHATIWGETRKRGRA